MKKCFLFIVLIASLLSFLGQAYAASTYFKGAWIQHLGWNNTVAGWETLPTSGYINFVSSIAVSGLDGQSLTTQEITSTPGIGLEERDNGFFPDQRYFLGIYRPPTFDFSVLSDWETTYNFNLEWNDGAEQSHTDSVTINKGELQILDIPYFTITGNIITWTPVDGADHYRITLLDETGSYAITSTPALYGTSYENTEEFIPGTYTLWFQARRMHRNSDGSIGDFFSSRSMYIDKITVTPIPGAFLLFGSGLLGLVGISRRKSN